MRSLIVAALLAGAAFGLSADDEPVITQAFVDQLNAVEGKTWTASADNGIFRHASMRTLRRRIGLEAPPDAKSMPPMRVFTEEEKLMNIPDEFDSATNWPECTTIPYVWDQSDCEGTWAVAVASAISDRLCTGGSNRTSQLMSAVKLLSCCHSCVPMHLRSEAGASGCGRYGMSSAAWQYWVDYGLITEECQPYPFPRCNHYSDGPYPPCGHNEYWRPTCSGGCTGNSTSAHVTKGKASYSLKGEEAFQRELMTNGPFIVLVQIYTDFPTYKSGVYVHTYGKPMGLTSFRLVGWGVLDGVKYWKIANSWNENWGMGGFFLMERGTDALYVESFGSAGVPF